MKRLKNAFELTIDFANLRNAAYKASKGKRKQLTTKRFLFNLEYELLSIKEELVKKTYILGKFHTFTIRDPKVRVISAAPFRDRVLHHAVCNVLEPWCERFYIFDSYACRKGKGQHRALLRAQKFARNSRYFFKFDIQKFFGSVCQDTLKQVLEYKIKDPDFLQLLSKIIDHAPKLIGLPIGNLTSQHFANIYLNELDQYIKHDLKRKKYIRYMDDAVIYGNSKEELWALKKDISIFLEEKLKLHFNEKSTFLRPIHQGIPFLGFNIYPHLIRIQRKNWQRFCRKFKKRQCQYEKEEIQACELLSSIGSLIGHTKQANIWTLRKNFFAKHEKSL